MMKINILTVALSITFLTIGCNEIDVNRSTDEIFVEYLSSDQEKISTAEKYFTYIKNSELSLLRANSLLPKKSMIAAVIDLSDGFEVDDIRYYKLLDLLITKGESLDYLNDSKCNFVDQLIMRGDINTFRFLINKGLKIPSDNECTIDILIEYKFRYDEQTYEIIMELLNEK